MDFFSAYKHSGISTYSNNIIKLPKGGEEEREREREMGIKREREGGSRPLFETEEAKGRMAYKLYVASIAISVCLILWYRANNIPGGSEEGRWVWVGMMVAELLFAFYWVITQSVRWNPIYRRTFKERLSERYGSNELPGVDIFICTADPIAEPPALVMSTVLSVMAYDYSPEKLSVYLSDDAGSIITFYALWEASHFAKHWLPYCKKFKVEPRSPAVYFSRSYDSLAICNFSEWSAMKILYEEMVDRINSVAMRSNIPEELKHHKGFSEWISGMTSRDHPPIVKIITDAKNTSSMDVDGNVLPTLVYMAREKRPQHHHNFKAGAMNALIRVSSAISNNPIILNLDCDMYSNDSQSIKDALCFFLDEDKGDDIGYVQYPQNFDNITKNDLYGNALSVINEVELHGYDTWGGPLYIGTGCFHRRESLSGRKYSKGYKEDWKRGFGRNHEESADTLEEKTKNLVTCTYEQNTQWGKEIGLMYGCSVEDVLTGLVIQCRGWRSIYLNPPKKGFLGVAPTSLEETLMQHKRWSEGDFHVLVSKYCPFIYGHGKIKLGLQMAYGIFCFWALISFPTIYYLTIPSFCLLKGIPLFPMMSSLWFIPFAYVIIAKNIYALVEAMQSGCTIKAWWNFQMMWVFRRETSYLYGAIENILKLLGISKLAFRITAKVTDEDVLKRYEQEIMEFGSSNSMLIISTVALLNLLCLVGVAKRLMVEEGMKALESLSLQVILCGIVVALNVPIYWGLFLRQDKGSIPTPITIASLSIAFLACHLLIM